LAGRHDALCRRADQRPGRSRPEGRRCLPHLPPEQPKSPNYERGFGDADLAEERMNPDELENFEIAIRRATEAWEKLDGYLAGLHREVRQAMLDLCVYETVPRVGRREHRRIDDRRTYPLKWWLL
jgi:hypothetical protein